MNEDAEIEEYTNEIILNKSIDSISNNNRKKSQNDMHDDLLKKEIEKNTQEKVI